MRPPGTVVLEESRPGVFAWTQKDAIGMRGCLVRQRRHMQTAEADVGAATTIVVSQLICPRSRRYVRLNHHQLGLIVQVESLDMLILNAQAVVIAQVAGERCQSEPVHEAASSETRNATIFATSRTRSAIVRPFCVARSGCWWAITFSKSMPAGR